MSFGMIDTEVRQQTREVRRQAARSRVLQPARPARAADSSRAHSLAMTGPPEAALRGQRHSSGLRSRVGFTLVETGLRLLASGQQAHG